MLVAMSSHIFSSTADVPSALPSLQVIDMAGLSVLAASSRPHLRPHVLCRCRDTSGLPGRCHRTTTTDEPMLRIPCPVAEPHDEPHDEEAADTLGDADAAVERRCHVARLDSDQVHPGRTYAPLGASAQGWHSMQEHCITLCPSRDYQGSAGLPLSIFAGLLLRCKRLALASMPDRRPECVCVLRATKPIDS